MIFLRFIGEMKGIQNKKGLDLQKPVQLPICVDQFDIGTVTGTKILTENPHRDGQIEFNKEEKLKQRKEKQSGKPMKMLIEEEMWRETETNQNPPSVVARLMGLNEFPEIETQNSRKDKNSNSYEKKMELIRQKFSEAKQLATNEKLFHSKEFQDALQFLSSNRDLFVKFLEEPNALFSQNPPISPEIKHITVLRPSEKISKLKNIERISCENQDDESFEKSRSKPLVPTRIVVLKPNLEKTLNPKLNNKSIYEESRSSFTKSEKSATLFGDEIEMSDLDVYTPTSGRSWDFNSRIESPIFESGIEIPVSDSPLFESRIESPVFESRTESPVFESRIESPVSLSSHESRVVREAKKRLVERWESVSSNLNKNEIEKEEKGEIMLGDVLTIHEGDKKEEREREEERENAICGLTRSKSLPVSFKNDDVAVPKEVEKSKSGKAGSFRWKLSSLFFSKNNNNSNKKGSLNEEKENGLVGTDPCTSSSRDLQENVDISTKEVVSEQEPSPVSVLEASSLSDNSDNFSLSSENPASLTSKIISRSPPIGSISRSLSWDNSQFEEIMSPNSLRLSRFFSKADEEQDSFTFIQKLVKFANLERQNKKTWFSLETPLDPSLFYEFLGYKFDEKLGKERLWFDSVNEAIVELEKCRELRFYPWFRVSGLGVKIEFKANMSDQIWSVVRNWCTTFERLSPNYEVDLVAKKEVSGTKLEEIKLFEMFSLSVEVCGFILEELMGELILEF